MLEYSFPLLQLKVSFLTDHGGYALLLLKTTTFLFSFLFLQSVTWDSYLCTEELIEEMSMGQ